MYKSKKVLYNYHRISKVSKFIKLHYIRQHLEKLEEVEGLFMYQGKFRKVCLERDWNSCQNEIKFSSCRTKEIGIEIKA